MTSRAEAIAALNERRRAGEALSSCLGEITFDGELLGQGGSAVVFPVQFGGAPAVAKFLVDLNSTQRRRRFQDEFQKLVRIRHRNVVALYHYEDVEVGEDIIVPMIVMERCETSMKRPFAELSTATERLELVKRLSVDILPALHHLHEAGIIHRDLKPENILRRSDGTLVVADFGIAKFDLALHADAGDVTRKGERLGNRAYSAPEQETNSPLAPSADIFAFGQLVHAAIFGHPLRGSTAGRATAVHERLAAWDGLLAKMLSMDPSARPQSVEHLRAELKKADSHARWMKEAHQGVEALRRFDAVVSEIAPGGRDLVEVTDRDEVARAMGVLARDAASLDLWWIRGPTDNPIDRPLQQLGEGVWLVDRHEMEPERLWVYKPSAGFSRHFIAILNKPRPGFFGEDPEDLRECSEAGCFDGRYITREEYDDGFARIDGEVVDTLGAQPRLRHHVPRAFIFVPRLGVLMGSQRDYESGRELVARLVAKLEAGEAVDEADLDAIDRLPRSLEVTMLD